MPYLSNFLLKGRVWPNYISHLGCPTSAIVDTFVFGEKGTIRQNLQHLVAQICVLLIKYLT